MTPQTEDLIKRLEAEQRSWESTRADDFTPMAFEGLLTEAAQALRALQAEVERLREADARLHAITREKKCPRCELTKAQCADTVAEIEIGRRSALTGSAPE